MAVFPNGSNGWYTNRRDGSTSCEDIIIMDLVPEIVSPDYSRTPQVVGAPFAAPALREIIRLERCRPKILTWSYWNRAFRTVLPAVAEIIGAEEYCARI